MSDKMITIDFSRPPEELYYEYKITVQKNNEGKITVVDGNCLLRDYGIYFKNLSELKADSFVMKNIISAGTDWPQDIKDILIKDCEKGNIINEP